MTLEHKISYVGKIKPSLFFLNNVESMNNRYGNLRVGWLENIASECVRKIVPISK